MKNKHGPALASQLSRRVVQRGSEQSQIVWGVKSPDGLFVLDTISETAELAANCFLWTDDCELGRFKRWADANAAGWSVVKVELREVASVTRKPQVTRKRAKK